jgi:hypothetical protein
MIYFLKKFRKLFKSLGKKEEKLNDLIIYENFKKNYFKNKLLENRYDPNHSYNKKFKIVVTISFLYNKNKIKFLKEICKNLNFITKNIKIYIITNEVSKKKIKGLQNQIKYKTEIKVVKNLANNRFLPWYHLVLMKKLFKNKNITHFLNLEDDILFTKKNFNYWINSRKILKKLNLIPGFVRTETNNKNKKLYALDFLQKNKFSKLPKFRINKEYYFLNHKFPYQGMYLYDRELMKEHLYGPSSNPDCGQGSFNPNFIDKNMINLSLLEKANIGLTYINKPKGFFSRMLILFNDKKNMIDESCLIKHLSNKYTNKISSFGKIEVKDAIK